jgi:hypothetical protein
MWKLVVILCFVIGFFASLCYAKSEEPCVESFDLALGIVKDKALKEKPNYNKKYFLYGIAEKGKSTWYFIYKSGTPKMLGYFKACGNVKFNKNSNVIVVNEKRNGRPYPEGCFQENKAWNGRKFESL